MDRDEIKAVLDSNPVFEGLEDFYFDDLVEIGDVRSWPRNSIVIAEGEAGDAVYFMLSGRARVVLYGEEGGRIVLAVLGPGEVFGEMSVIDEMPRSANVEAFDDMECLVVSRRRFLRYLGTHHKVVMRLLAYFSRRLRVATEKIGGLALLDVCGRIASTFMSMVGAEQREKGGVASIERMTHEEIAAMIGSSREVVSRALKKMAADGYIRIERRRILLFLDR
ncbi:MAG TPA: Crp/Fnr family transcriptional regulator [Deltaproteobacteria bacterium]|nr:Crp/Fnr family transcriptional regulator [Deltaproteobacteria bacterium]